MFGWLKKNKQPPIVMWCSLCSSEPASTVIEMELEGQWESVDVGKSCLTELREVGILK